LKSLRGRHTEFITISVPAGYNLNEISNQIRQEAGTASNIKSKSTRKNVESALAKMDQALKSVAYTPENGLCMYCGNISEQEGATDLKLWMFEPPEPINLRLYRCEQVFLLDHLYGLIEEKDVYGLMAIDSTEASIGFVIGTGIHISTHLTSHVPGKTGKGGQSAQRFERVRSGLLLTFLKQIGEAATKIFEENKYLKGIIIGGPGPVKDKFAAGEFLSNSLKRKILGIKDMSYSGNEGIYDLVNISEDILRNSKITDEKAIIIKFFEHLKKDDGLVVYGFVEIKYALELGAVDKILISEDLPIKNFLLTCNSCDYKEEKITKETSLPSHCPKCKNQLNKTEKTDFIEELEEMAISKGASILEVTSESPEGQQFLQLGGIGAFLRYKIQV